jgi:hypothetical protein
LDAAQQNELIQRQVELAHKMFGLELEKEASANEPVFLWQGAGRDSGSVRNCGHSVSAMSQLQDELRVKRETKITWPYCAALRFLNEPPVGDECALAAQPKLQHYKCPLVRFLSQRV